ncbi:uncharacterized protein LOC124420722 [Lucilia cuprina]|uniref:uncharacterized protein LOC124420722 n=1 Tax=Lucilia cuprina TaxID=7375 RepID=UPI001F06A170|nr:uncharacterized protein LOC124420722 [Lucilia cuprina]
MNIIFIPLILVFCTISSGLAAAFYGFYGDSAHPGKCVINGLILSPGEVYYNQTKCEKTTCDEKTMVYFLSCGIYKPPIDCKLGDAKYPDAPYPDCCPRHEICNGIAVDE